MPSLPSILSEIMSILRIVQPQVDEILRMLKPVCIFSILIKKKRILCWYVVAFPWYHHSNIRVCRSFLYNRDIHAICHSFLDGESVFTSQSDIETNHQSSASGTIQIWPVCIAHLRRCTFCSDFFYNNTLDVFTLTFPPWLHPCSFARDYPLFYNLALTISWFFLIFR